MAHHPGHGRRKVKSLYPFNSSPPQLFTKERRLPSRRCLRSAKQKLMASQPLNLTDYARRLLWRQKKPALSAVERVSAAPRPSTINPQPFSALHFLL
jgi:hypothetical protein